MKVPDEVLSMISNLVVANPEKVEKILSDLKSKKGVYSYDPNVKVQSIYSSFTSFDGNTRSKGGIIGEPNFTGLESVINQTDIIVTPDVTYVGREKQKPELVFSDHLRGATGLYLLQVNPSTFPETAKLFSQIKRFDSWKRKKLTEAYTFLGAKQREYFERFDPLTFNLFNDLSLAKEMGLNQSTVYRILCNRWIEARNIEGEQKVMFAKDLLKTETEITKYHNLSKLNKLLLEEYKNKKGYSDQEMARKIPSIARRTITKYRLESGFPAGSSRQREYADGKKEPFLFKLD